MCTELKVNPVIARARLSVAFELRCLRRESRPQARAAWIALRQTRLALTYWGALPGWHVKPKRWLQ